jgi:hypothetical protein
MKYRIIKILPEGFRPTAMNGNGDVVGFQVESSSTPLGPFVHNLTPALVWGVKSESTILPPVSGADYVLPLSINDEGMIAGLVVRVQPEQSYPEAPQRAFVYFPENGYHFLELEGARFDNIVITNDNTAGATMLFDNRDYGWDQCGVYENPFTRRRWYGYHTIPSAHRFVFAEGVWKPEAVTPSAEVLDGLRLGSLVILQLADHDGAARERGLFSWLLGANSQDRFLVNINENSQCCLPAVWDPTGLFHLIRAADQATAMTLAHALYLGDDDSLIGQELGEAQGTVAENSYSWLPKNGNGGAIMAGPGRALLKNSLVASPSGKFLAAAARKTHLPQPGQMAAGRHYENNPVVWIRTPGQGYGTPVEMEFLWPMAEEFGGILAVNDLGQALAWCVDYEGPPETFYLIEPGLEE